MATAQICTLRMDDSLNHTDATARTWVATASTLNTSAGSSVTITITQSNGGATAPLQADTLDLDLFIDNDSTLIKNFSINVTTPSPASFFFTIDGVSGTASRAGTVRMRLHAVNTTAALGANRYNVDSDLTNNTPPTGFHVHTADAGWIRGTTTLTSSLSNVGIGDVKSSPASYIDSLFVRTTLGSTLYSSRVLTVAMSGTTPALSGATNSATTGNFDVTFTSVVDNRYPASSSTTNTSVTIPNATISAQADFTVTATNDSMTVDPRFTITCQAQNSSTRSTNRTSYIISADQLFLWAKTVNARAGLVGNITITQRVKNGSTVLFTDTTQITAVATGFTPDPGVDATAIVIAPAGNRTQEAFPNAPANAVGLGTGTQTIGFASAYTANRFPAIQCNTEMDLGIVETIMAQYLETNGVALVLDTTPTIRIFQINTNGTQTDNIAPSLMTSIGNNSFSYSWTTPTTIGAYLIEVRMAKDGSNVEIIRGVTVRPRYVFDAVGIFK